MSREPLSEGDQARLEHRAKRGAQLRDNIDNVLRKHSDKSVHVGLAVDLIRELHWYDMEVEKGPEDD